MTAGFGRSQKVERRTDLHDSHREHGRRRQPGGAGRAVRLVVMSVSRPDTSSCHCGEPTSCSGAARLSNGQLMLEDADIGKRRAEQLAMLRQGANLKSPSYKVIWRDESAKATGVDDYAIRRAVITVRAGAAPR